MANFTTNIGIQGPPGPPVKQGLLAARPSASDDNKGTFWYATDLDSHQALSYSDGENWVSAGVPAHNTTITGSGDSLDPLTVSAAIVAGSAAGATALQSLTTDSSLTGAGTSGSHLAVAAAVVSGAASGASALQSVSRDSTLTGAGTSGSPLVVSGTIVSGAASGATALQTAAHDGTLSGAGTSGSPLKSVGAGRVHAADIATTAALAAYTITGSGSTLTFSATGALDSIDAQSPFLNAIYLVKDETTTVNNGLWQLTRLDSGGTPAQMTRATSLPVGENASGIIVPVKSGTQAGQPWVCTSATSAAIVGTNNLVFAHPSSGGASVVSTNLRGAAFGTSASGTLTFGANNHIVVDTTGLSSAAAVQLPSISTLSDGETRRVTSYIASGKLYGGTVISTFDSTDSIDFTGNYQDVLTASQSVEYSVHKASSTWRRQRRSQVSLDVRDFGALGIGSTHDDWPAFEAAFAFARANGVIIDASISLYVPKPPKYYWCTRRLRPGFNIYMHGDGFQGYGAYSLVNDDQGTTIRFPRGCPGLFFDSYPTSQSPYAPAGLGQSDNSTVERINFYGAGTVGLPTVGSPTPLWATNQNYTVNTYLKPSNGIRFVEGPGVVGNDYNYVARVVVAGNSGTVEPTWPTDVTTYVDGKVFYDSGVASPPAGSFPSGGNGTCVYEMQLAAGIRIQAVSTSLREVSVYGFCGSGILIMGDTGHLNDTGGLAEDWYLNKVSSFNHDRNAFQVSFTADIGHGDTGGGAADNCQGGAVCSYTVSDEGDVGNTWINIHAEFDNQRTATKRITPLFTPSLVLGGYSETLYGPIYGPQTIAIGSYDEFVGSTSTTIDPTSTGFVMGVAHRCNYLLGWHGISTNLGVGLCLGTWGTAYGPVNQPGYNAAFTICMARLPGGGFDPAAGTPNENYFFSYYNAPDYNGTSVLGNFYLHAGPGTAPTQSLNLGWGLTTTEGPHGPGHFLLGTGGYFGYTSTTWPAFWYQGSRSAQRYIAFDTSGYALSIADAGARSVGDRVDTPVATVNHLSLQVTRAGLISSVWQASHQYVYAGITPSPPIVRPRASATTQAWQMDTTFSSSGTTGASEPSWPASPSINDTVMDSGGAIRWKYIGTCARYQPFGQVGGLITFSVAGSSNVTLTETSENFLASSMILTGVLTGNINLILPTLTSTGLNSIYPTEPYTRWIYNNTSGSFTVTVKTAAGTGPTITQGQAAWVLFDGTNILRMSADVAP